MLKDILDFIRKEKFYFGLFLVVTTLYAGIWIFANQQGQDKPDESSAIQEFREAEKRVFEKMSKPKTFDEYLKPQNKVPYWLQIFSVIMMVAFGLGLMIDFRLWFQPGWRHSFVVSDSMDRIDWKVSMLFKVIVLWMTFAIGTSLFFGLLQNIFLKDLSLNFYILFQTTLLDILIVLLIYYMVKKHQGGWRDLGVHKPIGSWWKEISIGFGAYLAVVPLFFIVLVALIVISQMIQYEPPPHPLVAVFLEEEKKMPVLVIYSIILASFLGPFFEELFFRGFCYPIFKKRWGMGWGMVLSAGFFAAIHHSGFAFWPIFILGMGLAYLYEKRKSLVAPIALHIIHNSFFIAYFFIAKKFVMSQGGG